MAWSPPDQVPQAQIQSYQVSVDGQLKATIRGNDRTKALLEKVDIAKVWGCRSTGDLSGKVIDYRYRRYF